MGEDMICGDGMTERVRRALRAVARQVVPAMFKSQQPWALMGSTCSVLQGIDGYTPPDIDLVAIRKSQPDVDLVRPDAVMRTRCFDHDATSRYAPKPLFELADMLGDRIANWRLRWHALEIDFDRSFHALLHHEAD